MVSWISHALISPKRQTLITKGLLHFYGFLPYIRIHCWFWLNKHERFSYRSTISGLESQTEDLRKHCLRTVPSRSQGSVRQLWNFFPVHILWKFFESTFSSHADSDILSDVCLKTTFQLECVPEKMPRLEHWALRAQRYSIKKQVYEEMIKKSNFWNSECILFIIPWMWNPCKFYLPPIKLL